MQKDLTVIYITASEIPEKFALYQRATLETAIGDTPIITVSRKPLEMHARLNLIDDEPKCLSNIYWQILRAAYYVETPYVAIAEDDTLYSKEHFDLRPPDNQTFVYNQNRFALFTWGDPIYSWRNRKSNASLVAPTEYLKDALVERFMKWPQGTPDKITGEVGRGMVERNLGISLRNSVEMFSEVSIIQFNHANASEDRQVRKRKRLGQIKAYDLYGWGHAKNLVKFYE